VGESFSTHGRIRNVLQWYWSENLKGRNHFEDQAYMEDNINLDLLETERYGGNWINLGCESSGCDQHTHER